MSAKPAVSIHFSPHFCYYKSIPFNCINVCKSIVTSMEIQINISSYIHTRSEIILQSHTLHHYNIVLMHLVILYYLHWRIENAQISHHVRYYYNQQIPIKSCTSLKSYWAHFYYIASVVVILHVFNYIISVCVRFMCVQQV